MFFELPPFIVQSLVLLLGALTVLVHAKQQFEVSNYPLDGSYAEILSSAPTSVLAGTSTFGRGRFFYICIFLGIYGLLCSSTLLLNLAALTAENYNIDVVGIEIDPKSKSISAKNGLDYTIPLAVAALIITFTSIPPFSEIEKVIRSLAHSASGIPRNIYYAIDKIIRFDLVGWEGETSLTVRDAKKFGAAVTEAAEAANVPKGAATAMGKSATKIEAIIPWIDGQMVLFSEKSRSEVAPLVNGIVASSSALLPKIHDLLNDKNSDEVAWENISNAISKTERNVAAAFGLLAINNPGCRPNDNAPAISSMLEEIEGAADHKPLNSVIGALIWGASFSIILASILRLISNIITKNLESKEVPQTISQAFAPQDINSLFGSIAFGITNGMNDVLLNSALFSVSVLTALSVRITRLEHNNWTHYSNKHRHYTQYFLVTLLTTIIVVIPIFLLLQALSASGGQLWSTVDGIKEAAEILRSNHFWSSFAGFLLAIPVIWSSLKLCDIVDVDPQSLNTSIYFKAVLFVFIFAVAASIPIISNQEISSVFDVISIAIVEILIPFLCFSSFLIMLGITLKRQSS